MPAIPDSTAAVGGLPAVDPGCTVVHDHPLSTRSRVLVVLYGVVVAIVGATVLVLLFEADQRDQDQRDQILAEFDRRTEARDLSDALVQRQIERQREATRSALCTFLTADLEPTPALLTLSEQFQCPIIPSPEGTP